MNEFRLNIKKFRMAGSYHTGRLIRASLRHELPRHRWASTRSLALADLGLPENWVYEEDMLLKRARSVFAAREGIGLLSAWDSVKALVDYEFDPDVRTDLSLQTIPRNGRVMIDPNLLRLTAKADE